MSKNAKIKGENVKELTFEVKDLNLDERIEFNNIIIKSGGISSLSWGDWVNLVRIATTLTDEQFDAIFDFIDSKLEFVLEYEMDNPDILEEWEDLFDAHEALYNVKKEYEDKLAKAQAKQPKAEW